jgi:hypothetical protein
MKKIAFLLLLIINSFSAFADAYLYIDDVSIKPGETKDLSVKLKNDVDITAFQCDLYLPTGISVVQTFDSNINKNTNDIALTDRKQSTHSLSSNVQSDGAMRIVAFSSKNEAFSGNDGALFTIKIKADDNIAIGKYTIRLANVELTTPAGKFINPIERNSSLSIVYEYTIIAGSATEGGSVTGAGIFTSDQSVTLTATPETGYHFVSWSNGSKANPLVFTPTKSETINATFAPNKYAVNYLIDGTIVHVDSVEYKSSITVWTAPTKDYYTFSGWSTIPATMPAHDVTITGSFAANSYNLIYMVDGTEYKRTSLSYGSAITPEPAPTKEGYAFSGWSTIPATMPAHDVTITGSFAANSYNLIYMVDGTEYKRTSLACGSAITPEPAPTKEGYAFSGWSTIPATMPAHDVTITGSFAANSYNLIYMVDGTEYKRTSLSYGSAITPEPAPTKEGYAFSGWSTIPATMPAHDVTITGSFAANSYNLIYMVDGTEYKRTSLACGSAITPEPAPTKEGYAFSGWSTIPATMPAHDVTITGSFAANSYNLIYMVDGTEYKRTSLAYGSAITPEPAPTKEGYAFSGWSTIPATMPAHDVTITGSFAANSYNLIYMVDGTEYKRTSLACGSAITPEPAPTKEGYAFSGWSTIPATMPAHDVTITGSFAANSYNLIYMVDGTEYKRTSLAYGSAITPEPAPTKEGYAFSGWSTIPATMPAHDVTITGSFAANSYNLIYMVDGTEYKRTSLSYGSAITPEPAPTKEGYAFSGWSTIPATMPAHDVTITGSFAANSYNLIYMVDGTEYKRTSLAYGSAITPEPAPTKEGYAFSGWSTIPATMPAHDVTITGSFAANSYNLIYMVDGTEYKRTSLAYGSAITPEPAPTKEGYAFSGWSTIPATMPAHDVTITGSFAANSYNLIYMVDGTEYKRTSLSYGSAITPEPAPTKEGYAFSGWSTIPATMPAHDVTITGSFAANSYNLIYMVDGTEYKRTSLACGSAITPEPAPTKEGYAFSGWSTIPATMPAHDVTITGSFAANSYNLIYMVDGTEYKRTSLAYGSAITPEPAPTKEGYAFSGWSTIPATMPAHDVTITGSFAANSYNLIYMVDGTEYKRTSLAYGSAITPEPAPTKEGYAFSGWSTIPATMPAHDVTITGSFAANSYNLIYMVDGTEYKRTSLSYGSAITPEPAPTKEGYAFSGWSTIPATMPAHDVTITGSFAANSYNLIYMVDGTEYKRTSLSYGSAITPEPAPTKEGYAFSGWSTIPATMPAHDVTITGSFAANSYNLIYMVDGTEYKRTSLAYGSAITPEPAPTKEGYAFSGWSTIPATMPAHDVTITGTFNVNYYTITYKVDGIIYKTVSVAYGSILTPEPAPTKEGYVFSGWSTIPETMPANDIEVTGSFIVSGIKEISSNSFVNVYNLEGKRIKSHIDVNALKEILPTGVYIVNGKKYCIIHD